MVCEDKENIMIKVRKARRKYNETGGKYVKDTKQDYVKYQQCSTTGYS